MFLQYLNKHQVWIKKNKFILFLMIFFLLLRTCTCIFKIIISGNFKKRVDNQLSISMHTEKNVLKSLVQKKMLIKFIRETLDSNLISYSLINSYSKTTSFICIKKAYLDWKAIVKMVSRDNVNHIQTLKSLKKNASFMRI